MGKWIRKTHKCRLPGNSRVGEGSVWQCRCRQMWYLKRTGAHSNFWIPFHYKKGQQ